MDEKVTVVGLIHHLRVISYSLTEPRMLKANQFSEVGIFRIPMYLQQLQQKLIFSLSS